MSKQRQFPYIWNRRHFAKPRRTFVGDPNDVEYKVRTEYPDRCRNLGTQTKTYPVDYSTVVGLSKEVDVFGKYIHSPGHLKVASQRDSEILVY